MRQCMDADNLHRRLKKIIGQLGAIDKMVDQDVPCEDMLMQINAAKSALHKVGQVVLEGHLNHCVRVSLLLLSGRFCAALRSLCSLGTLGAVRTRRSVLSILAIGTLLAGSV